MNNIRIDITKLKWFSDDLPAGSPGCACSACRKLIFKTDICIRLICGPCHKQLRFHYDCYEHWFADLTNART